METVDLDLNLPAFVIRELLTPQDLSLLGAALSHTSFDTLEAAHVNSTYAHASVNLGASFVETLPFFDETTKFIGALGYEKRVLRAYCNRLSFNDHTDIHVDCERAGETMTLVVFVHAVWHSAWGGEFGFVNQAENSILHISPVPGRAILFDGYLPHVGFPPNEFATLPRLSLVLKFGG